MRFAAVYCEALTDADNHKANSVTILLAIMALALVDFAVNAG